MTKYILVSGGVVSGIGKGVIGVFYASFTILAYDSLVGANMKLRPPVYF
jgi:CTP synthase (UTP-ammonia lyase)